MKFRSKTGEVFENTYEDVTFCGPYKGCIGCPVGNIKQNYDCTEWVNNHPHEATRLMGFKVVEEDEKCATCANQKTVECVTCGALYRNYQEKETDMDKPRICEVLGVEVGEVFGFNEFPFDRLREFLVNESGIIRPNGDGYISPSDICQIINNTDCIIRKPRWTEQEVEDAKTIKRMFGDDNFTHIHKDEDGFCEMMDGPGDDPNAGWCSIGMEEGMFPSLCPGETVTLNEIIGGAE